MSKNLKRKLDSCDLNQQSLFSFMNVPKKQKTDDTYDSVDTGKLSANDSLKTDVTSKKTDRRFKNEWKEKFPFLRYDSNKVLMFCSLCERAGRNNVWTSGCDKFKVDAIKKHSLTGDHKFALSAQNANVSIETAAIRAAEKERDGVEGLMKNLYYLARRNEPSSAISDLNKLLITHNVARFSSLVKADKSMPYEHHESVSEMQNAMAEVARQQLIDDIKQSGLFSVICDESTDVSTEKTLIFYVRYAIDGQPNTKFLEVTEINGDECNAKSLCDTILRVLESRNLSVENIACATTDGASVMTGVRGGVTTLLKQRNNRMVSIHCIAHRLALASGQSADSIPYLKKYQAMINSIFKYYHYSPKHQSRLRKIQQVFEMAEKKFQQTFHTRWLSFEGAVDAVIQNFDALVTCLEMDCAENGDPMASGLLKFVTDYRFLYTSHMLKDILVVLCILSKIFQRRDLTVSELSCQLRAAISSVRAMKNEPGPFLQQFINSLPSDYENGFEFGQDGHTNRIKCSQELVSVTKKSMEKYVDSLLLNLNERFANDSGIISSFSILDPVKLPSSADDLFSYGNKEINKLGEFYSEGGHSPMSVNKDELSVEWNLFKYFMFDNYRNMQFKVMAETVLKSQNMLATYPNISHLIKVCLILPVSSADCERGFSRYNLIKTKLRNRLYTSTVNTLMMMTVDTPGIENMNNFEFSKAFNIWAASKQRRTGQFNKLKL